MDQSLFKFDLIAEDPTTHARAGVLHTPHGDIETPIFMPVGTKANVKGIPTETVKQLGAQIVLANTYHLSMRPGEDTIAELGGLHKFMNWHGPILTDSGGFQVFSHNDAVKLTDEGVRFIVNDYDGRHVFWTPEDNMEIAMKLGSDICMQLDQCPGYPATRAYVERAVELSSMWAERCYKAHTRDDQALFGIVQGGMHLDLRVRSLRHLEDAGDFPGYGIGGYSVGEDHDTMFESLEPLCAEYMPKGKPRYLMGVGNPDCLLEGVERGVDMFDCVLPTRTGRMGTAFSSEGRLNFRNARFAHDDGPIDPTCTCPVCTGGCSRALIRHMVTQKEMLGGILLGVICSVVFAIPVIAVDKLTGGTGVAGAAISSCAGANVATPAAMASVNEAMYGGAVLATATAQVAACAIVTAILTPLVTSWCHKHCEGQQSNSKATTDKAASAA